MRCVACTGALEGVDQENPEPMFRTAHVPSQGYVDNDVFCPLIPLGSAHDILLDLEKRYCSKDRQITQADFFRPKELENASISTTPPIIVLEFDPPPHPSIPRITVSKPEDETDSASIPVYAHATGKEVHSDQRTLLQDNHRKLTHRIDSLARRHSMINVLSESRDGTRSLPKTPVPVISTSNKSHRWQTTESSQKKGLTMKTRMPAKDLAVPSVDIVVVYMYDSATCDQSQDHDADLEMFLCRTTTNTEDLDSVPLKKIRRAGTDIFKQTKDTSNFLTPTKQGRLNAGEYLNRRGGSGANVVNWLHDENMLGRQMLGSRKSAVGFDLSPRSPASGDLECAAAQINEYLHKLRH